MRACYHALCGSWYNQRSCHCTLCRVVRAQEWIPVYGSNCAERTRDAAYVDMVERADAIFMSGGQSGRLQSCLYGQLHCAPTKNTKFNVYRTQSMCPNFAVTKC
jgi:hypothetical protein